MLQNISESGVKLCLSVRICGKETETGCRAVWMKQVQRQMCYLYIQEFDC